MNDLTLPPDMPLMGASFDDITRRMQQSLGRPVQETLFLSSLILDPKLQMRVALDRKHIENDLMPKIRDGATLHPITVYKVGGYYYVTDGRHRVEAYRNLGHAEVLADVYLGTWEDAFRAALTANQNHGLRLTSLDKRKIVQSAIDHWRADLESGTISVQELANRVGNAVNRTLVYEMVNEQEIEKPASVTVNRGGSTFEMPTRNIGRKRTGASPEPAHAEPSADDWQGEDFTAPLDDAVLQERMARLANEKAIAYATEMVGLDPEDAAQPDDYAAGLVSLLMSRRVAVRLYELLVDLTGLTAPTDEDRLLVRSLKPQIELALGWAGQDDDKE